jgi:cytoplasmic iron level regulating protein YaaA (DUF328/UPF0246 family)
MKVIISPSKTLSLTKPSKNSLPYFDSFANLLFKDFETMDAVSLEAFFKCSKDISLQTKNYYLDKNRYHALSIFQGISFKTFQSFKPVDTKNLYIASGIYGLISPSDAVRPYRCDLIHPTYGSLIPFWKPKLYLYLNDEDLIYLCVSKEYEVLFDKRLPLVFIDIYLGNKKAPSVDAKKVRGAFAYYLISHASKEIKDFQYNGYVVTSIDSNVITIIKESN